MSKHLLAIDVECTCEDELVNPHMKKEIIEIGITKITPGGLLPNSIFVRPSTEKITPFCTNLTSITPEEIEKKGVAFVEAWKTLMTEYNSLKSIILTWGQFDVDNIRDNCKWNGLKYPFRNNCHINVKALFMAVTGETRAGLDDAGKYLDIPFAGKHHRGKWDSLMVAGIYRELVK